MFFICPKRLVLSAVFSLLICATFASAQTFTGDFLPQPTINAHTITENGASFETDVKTAVKDIKYKFQPVETRRRNLEFEAAIDDAEAERKSFEPVQSSRITLKNADRDRTAKMNSARDGDAQDSIQNEKFQWRAAITQSLMFLAVQHGYAIGAQAKTRRALKHGAFFRDYANSVKSLHGWDDGGKVFTNYLAHPMQGSLTGFIYVQNSPKERKLEFNESPAYWRSRLKALVWTAAWSTQFELGPISQAAIGNVGLQGKQTWVDIVITPTFGTAMLIGEDAIDRFIIKRIERHTSNRYVKILARVFLNPTRNFSNLLRFQEPWYRDRPNAR